MIVILTWGMGNGNDFPVQYPQCEEPLLTVGPTEIFGRDRVAIQDLSASAKSMLCLSRFARRLSSSQVNMITIVAT